MSNIYSKLAWFITIVTIAVFVINSSAVAFDTPKVAGEATRNSNTVSSEVSQNVELLNHMGGSIQIVAAQDNYIYAGFSGEFSVLNPSIPGSPQRIGYTILPGSIQDITLIGNYAFTANGSSGMSIVDISNSTTPTELSSLDTPGDGKAITASNGYAYVADGVQGVRVINISNISAPFETNYISTPSPAQDVLVSGNYLFIADYMSGLLVFDISDPLNPIQAGFLSTPGDALNMALVDNDLLLASDYAGLCIISINNPTSPQEISSVEGLGYASNVSVFWPYAYVSDWYGATLHIIDISNLQHPASVGSFHSNNIVHGLYGVAVVGNQAFVSMAERGLYTLDISNPSYPTQLGVFDFLGTLSDLTIWQNYLYVSNGDVVAIDITDPSLPVMLGSTTNDGLTHAVGAYAGYTYADNSYFPPQVNITNFTNPNTPIQVGSFETPGSLRQMKVSAGYGYLGVNGLQIMNLTNPASPILIGTYKSINSVDSLAVQGDYVYLADGENLRIIDASDKSNPFSVGLLGLAYEVTRVDVQGNYVYAAWTNYNYEGGGFSVIDISDPSQPVEVSRTLTTSGARGIAAENNVLYVGAGSQGLLMYDISNKTSPIQVGYFANSFGGVLILKDNILYMSAEAGGLFIFTPKVFTISGIVQGPNNAPIPGVTIQTQDETEITDQDGKFQFLNQLPGTHTLTPVDPPGVYLPSYQNVSVPPNSNNLVFHMLPEPVSVIITPGITTTLGYIDLQGMSTQLIFPLGAVAETVTATLEPILPSPHVGFFSTGHTFDLIIEHDGLPVPGLTFNLPVDVSIQYSNYDIRGVVDEGELTVWWVLGTAWQDAPISCSPPTGYTRDTSGNLIGVPICQSGEFTLMGPTLSFFLPIMMLNNH